MYGTAADVRKVAGVTPGDLGLDRDAAGAANPTAEDDLDLLLSVWLERLTAAINVRLRGSIPEHDDAYPGITDVAVRFCGRLVAYAIQMREGPVVRVSDFAVRVVNAADVLDDLDEELEPYMAFAVASAGAPAAARAKVNFFLAGRE